MDVDRDTLYAWALFDTVNRFRSQVKLYIFMGFERAPNGSISMRSPYLQGVQVHFEPLK